MLFDAYLMLDQQSRPVLLELSLGGDGDGTSSIREPLWESLGKPQYVDLLVETGAGPVMRLLHVAVQGARLEGADMFVSFHDALASLAEPRRNGRYEPMGSGT